MNEIIKNIEAAQLKDSVPEFAVGDTVRVHNKIKEGNRERIQIFEGTVIKRQNGGARETFTVRKNSNGIGVEKTWPVHSPFVADIEVVRKGKVRRAKLNYLRDRVGKPAEPVQIESMPTDRFPTPTALHSSVSSESCSSFLFSKVFLFILHSFL